MVEPAPLETQRERRRTHLVDVTAHVIATYGVDAVSHALVAELAGCTRTLVYNYFSRREDLLYAVIESFDDGRQRLDLREICHWLQEHPTWKKTTAKGRAQLEELWRPDDWRPEALELRLAVITLIREVHLGTALGDHQADLERWIDTRLHEPLRELGLAPIQVKIVVDTLLALQYHVVEAGLNGELSREEAIDLILQSSGKVLGLFRD